MSNFTWKELDEKTKNRITGLTYPDTNEALEITYEDLAFVEVLHYNFENKVTQGELICNKAIADKLICIFKELYEAGYQIEKIRLIDEYGADDLISMADNNSSAFNYRVISGTDILSNHSLGLAIDINPFYNPYVFDRNGMHQVQPVEGIEYEDRGRAFAHKIDHDDLCYQTFIKYGFTWGGDWEDSKDYQHFEYALRR